MVKSWNNAIQQQKGTEIDSKTWKSEKQGIRRLSGIIMWWTSGPNIIMDDDSYLTYSRSEIPRSAVVYAASDSDLAEKVKFKEEKI